MSEHSQKNPRRRFPILDLEGPITRPLTIEERYETLETLYKYQYFATYRHIAQHAGWDVAKKIADDMAAEAIPHIAEGYKRRYGLRGEGVALVAQVHITEMIVEGADVETITESEVEAEYKVLCPWGDAIQSGKFDDAEPIYDALCGGSCRDFMQRVADTVAGDIQVDRKAWMGDGAPRCHFRVCVKN
jgi:hypothetical protein